ncbi:TIGR03084 family metal-binding protein [Streptomyces sp. NBC_00338]|uniref:TIGR03084 family metal-binding protein n=1 Tax=Streptomyces sp. NBC_00338 TaxID=2975715 RepID=UPI002257D1E1|nr:TIGR03084 family metal-binding protein [Streptomyces sp. NBC_00338]MCX5142031.1 TIGR03084 family metal-binding protein [Streptomyces sp. NBC_00338]
MSDASAVLDDLRSESEELDLIVAGLNARQWAGATPAAGWTVAHQVAHLSWTDEVALLSVTEPERFGDEVARAMKDPEGFVDRAADEVVTAYAPDALLVRWRTGRARLQDALRAAPAGTRFPWYGPPMSVASMATGRLMETWAHGQDVADALGVTRTPTARLRHVARIGVRARDYAFLVRGIQAPTEEFRVELGAPDGDPVVFGPEDAAQRVTGPLHDFCLLVTQRAHRDDLSVRAEGADADAWLDIAQAFAGPAGTGRAPKADR